MKLNLVKNGIFPIIKDINGNPISEIPDTGYIEVFYKAKYLKIQLLLFFLIYC
jgi:hypothetical protein